MALDARDGDAAAAVREATGGGAHVSLDALGSAGTCAASVALAAQARAATCRSGCCSADERSVAGPDGPRDRLRAASSPASTAWPCATTRRCSGAIAAGRLDPARLVGTTVALEQAGAELAAMSGFARHGATVITSF